MIEVIKNNARKEFECPDCKSIIAYDPADIEEYGDVLNWYSYVKCPICDHEYVIEKIDALAETRIDINCYGGYQKVYYCPKCGERYVHESNGVSYCINKHPFTCKCGEKLYIGD